jgi:hypothetical protein
MLKGESHLLESILADFEKHLGVRAVKGKDEMQGFFQIDIDLKTQVWVKDLDPGVFFRSTIAPLPSSGLEDLFMYLSKANFLGQGTGGGVISIEPGENFLTLGLNIPYEVNYKIFRDKLEDFVNYLEFWKSEIERIVNSEELIS